MNYRNECGVCWDAANYRRSLNGNVAVWTMNETLEPTVLVCGSVTVTTTTTTTTFTITAATTLGKV